ncbi:MAG TPA: glycerol-3-phosphate dehydrogenase [Steroidobacteraceae bacterium]|nr:glycerol-3-phosphate dehydrogenase [Steroidobacteraceae bacterium]
MRGGALKDTVGDGEVYDLAVVGGGINGAGIARDAAGRGLSVCLLEQDDLASHTSSASTKLIHGGLRYLEQREFRLVRESLAERERLLAIAPHIIRPLRFVLPYVEGLRPRWLLRLGLFVYDHAGKRSSSAALRGPNSRSGRRESLAASRSVNFDSEGFEQLGAPLKPAMRNGFEYSDCWVDDSRLVVLNALDAAERGARVLTRTRLLRAQAVSGLWQLDCEDRSSGRRVALRARALANAGGAWVNDLLGRLGVTPRQELRLVKGSHIILPRLYEGEHAYLLQSPDRRVIFAIPYESRFTLIGTTDLPFDGDPAQVAITAAEVGYLCENLNRFFAKPIAPGDVLGSYAGVRALHDDGSRGDAQTASRDYTLDVQRVEGGPPLLSVYGGKITTYRRLAEAALALLLPLLDRAGAADWTQQEALPGGDFAAGDLGRFALQARQRWHGLPATLVDRLASCYGTRMAQILNDAQRLADLGEDFGAGLTGAEVDYLVRHEWARSAEDVLWRRTKLGLVLPAEGKRELARYLDLRLRQSS